MDLTQDKEKLQILKLILAAQEMARPFAAPPGIPADRKAALVTAFDATMKDPEYLADAKKLDIDVNPVSGKALDDIAGRALRHAEGRGEKGRRGDYEVGLPCIESCAVTGRAVPIVMAGLVPAIHVLLADIRKARRGCPAHGRA